ncbi:unnamed protein product, partial [Prorocentrum cordatum]
MTLKSDKPSTRTSLSLPTSERQRTAPQSALGCYNAKLLHRGAGEEDIIGERVFRGTFPSRHASQGARPPAERRASMTSQVSRALAAWLVKGAGASEERQKAAPVSGKDAFEAFVDGRSIRQGRASSAWLSCPALAGR